MMRELFGKNYRLAKSGKSRRKLRRSRVSVAEGPLMKQSWFWREVALDLAHAGATSATLALDCALPAPVSAPKFAPQ